MTEDEAKDQHCLGFIESLPAPTPWKWTSVRVLQLGLRASGERLVDSDTSPLHTLVLGDRERVGSPTLLCLAQKLVRRYCPH